MQSIPLPPSSPDPVRSNDWKGEETGDTITGVVTGRETKKSEKYGSEFEVLTVKNGDGEKQVMCARSHLAQLVEENDPQPGDGIAISFFGEKPDGFGYLYAMRVQKASGAAGLPATDADEDIPFHHEPNHDWVELKGHANR